MAIEVPMSYLVCRWCGCPFSFPTAMGENNSLTLRCPSGHRRSDGQTVEGELSEAREMHDLRFAEVTALRATVTSLKGQITKLKKAQRSGS